MKNQNIKKRVVVKVGTHVLSENGKLCKKRFKALCEFLAKLSNKNEVILVSSAAIVSGYSKIKLDKSILSNRQALAAVGQPVLMRTYAKYLKKYSKLSAQILLSGHDFDSRRATKKAKTAIDSLLKNNIIPIVNENDATATEEIVFGDNDQLSSRVAYYFGANMLVILSDIDGYYDKDPRKYSNAKVQKLVCNIKDEQLSLPKEAGSEFGTGGIVTKLKAASYLLQRDKKMFLTSGFDLDDAKSFLLKKIHKGGTLFSKEGR